MTTFITLQIANGNAYFAGLFMVMLGAICRSVNRCKMAGWILAIIGITCVAISATPLSMWGYGIWAIAVMVAFCPLRSINARATRIATAFLVLLSCAMICFELTYRRTPTVPISDRQTVYVIGDSISMGILQEKAPWPLVLRDEYHVNLVNLAQAGATARTALMQISRITESNSVVLLEIGGNDLLGITKASDFMVDLDKLLGTLRAQGHRVVMFELPLLPFHNSFGRTQRLLADKHGVIMFPKTYLAQVLGISGGTLDGIHLSQAGHDALAEIVYPCLRLGNAATTTSDFK